MNARVEELGLAHTHFANPHGISDEDHYTSCYDMAQILRWALEQPGLSRCSPAMRCTPCSPPISSP